MKKIETFDSGRWKAFFRCSNELCKAWFPYKVIETFYDKTLIQGTENKTKWQKIFHSEKYSGTVKRKYKKHDLLYGFSIKNNLYDDNTIATQKIVDG